MRTERWVAVSNVNLVAADRLCDPQAKTEVLEQLEFIERSAKSFQSNDPNVDATAQRNEHDHS